MRFWSVSVTTEVTHGLTIAADTAEEAIRLAQEVIKDHLDRGECALLEKDDKRICVEETAG